MLQQFVKSKFANAPNMPREDQPVDKPVNMELPTDTIVKPLSSEDKY